MKDKTLLVVLSIVIFCSGMFLILTKKRENPPEINPNEFTEIRKPELSPIQFKLKESNPSYMNYDQTVSKLKEWESEASELVDVGTYGKSSKGRDLYYLRVTNERIKEKRPVILITACIHGNEPLSSSVVMWYIGNL